MARVSKGGVREPFFFKRVRAPLLFLPVSKNILGYSTRNGKFKRLEPHFQISVTRSGWKEVTETAVAPPRSRECTKKPIPPLRNIGSMDKFVAMTEQNDEITYRKN